MARMTGDQKAEFVRLMHRSGVAEYVLAHLGLTRTDLKAAQEADLSFAQACDDSLQIRRATIEEEVTRRAIDGWDEPVYHRGELAGHIRRFSDPMLALLARRHIPAYRESVRVEQQVSGSIDVGLEPLRQLSPDAQRKLLEIVVEVEGRAVPALGSGDGSST